MTVSNASESRLALWTGAAGIVLGGILVGALVVGAISLARRGRAGAPEAAPDVLAPDAGAVRYRYAIGAAAPADAGDEIAALEARVAAQRSPFDDAALGELHLRRSPRSGDADDQQRAPARAERALAPLALPTSSGPTPPH